LPDPLSEREINLLVRLEADIEQNLKGFRTVGYALTVIRDQSLYRANYDTFEDYCREEWDMGRPHAYRLIDSNKVIENLSPIGGQMSPIGDKTDSPKIEILPANERQVRPLATLSPEQQIDVWMMVIEEAKGGKITAAMVQHCVDSVRQGKERTAVEKAKKASKGEEEGGNIFQDIINTSLQPLFDLVALGSKQNWKHIKKNKVIEALREILAALEE
jgi:hypothetical protein